jgi:hypothetical protein
MVSSGKKILRILSIITISTALLLTSCVQKPGEKPVDEKSKEEKNEKTGIKALDKLVDNVKEMQKKMEESKNVEVVDFRELKEMLPDEIAGLNKTNTGGEKNSTMGFTISKAEAEYSNEDSDEKLKIEISDMGDLSGLTGLTIFAWAFAEFEKENEDGYEKTIKYKGHKGFEKYNYPSRRGNMDVLVAERYMLQVNGYNVSMDVIKAAYEKIDISKLEAMKEAEIIKE